MMTIKRYFLLLAALCVLIFNQSCSVTEEVYFNEDFSGKRSIKVDMSQMVQFMEMMGEGMGDEDGDKKDDKEDKGFKEGMMEGLNKEGGTEEIIKELNDIEGVTNAFAKIDTNTMVIEIGYDFKDLEALNRAFKKSSSLGEKFDTGMPDDGKKKKQNTEGPYILKGNTLIFEDESFDMFDEEAEKEEVDQMAGAFGSMLTYEVIMHFKKEVKSVEGTNMSLLDDKTVRGSMSMEELEESDEANRMVIKFK